MRNLFLVNCFWKIMNFNSGTWFLFILMMNYTKILKNLFKFLLKNWFYDIVFKLNETKMTKTLVYSLSTSMTNFLFCSSKTCWKEVCFWLNLHDGQFFNLPRIKRSKLILVYHAFKVLKNKSLGIKVIKDFQIKDF